MREQLQELGEPLVLGGDARNDSPGHTAKYGSYTFMEMNINKVIHVELVQKSEVANSYNMELEALRRGLVWVEQTDLELGTIITDRHVQVRAWIRQNLKEVQHYFDVWHISKGLKKKLRAAGMKKDCELLHQWTKSITNHMYWVASSTPDAGQEVMAAKWSSMINHIMNIHDHETDVFPQCLHGPLAEVDERIAWILPNSTAADEVIRICQSKYLLKDIKMMSPAQQTSSVEAYHGTINYFAPKLYVYSYQGMHARLLLAAMHFNENSGRAQRKKKDGTEQWSISHPRGRDTYVLRKVLVNPTYEYVHELFSESTRLALSRNTNLREETPLLCNVPPPMSTSMERPTMDEALEREKSRFAKGP
ncbi:uncharacterized protein LOC105444839 [Strongylocentrotus purpuratus]|uniref:Uncharacterized protein n=1 Tax=Strongylocentrotus purpuratus TaxID=7668 RepID=A0A7M7LTN6_STRPU|nr:uncharacterized protein LOC105444839 [Strongylocentrotus purpuratus]